MFVSARFHQIEWRRLSWLLPWSSKGLWHLDCYEKDLCSRGRL